MKENEYVFPEDDSEEFDPFYTDPFPMRGKVPPRNIPEIEFCPTLYVIPKELIVRFRVNLIEKELIDPLKKSSEIVFDINDCPPLTGDFAGFELLIEYNFFQETEEGEGWKRSSDSHVTKFGVYNEYCSPIIDYPMLSQSYVDWSKSTWACQLNPQKNIYAQQWHEFVSDYNFDVLPDPERVKEYISFYRSCLKVAKDNGITFIQPSAMFRDDVRFNWNTHGFAALPNNISNDLEHPWTQFFKKNYDSFRGSYLKNKLSFDISTMNEKSVIGLTYSRF